jgi:hypothetical protein
VEGVHTFIPAGDDPNAPAGTVIQGRQSAILTADQVIALFFQIRELVPQVQASGTLSGLPQRADGSSVYLTDIKSDLPKPYSCLAESPFFKWSSPVSEGGYDLDLANEDRFRRDMVAWGAKYPFLYAFLWWLQDQMRGNPELEARYQDLGVSTTDRVFAPMPALGEMTVIEEPLPNPDAGKDAHEGPVSADPDQWWADFSAWAQKAKNQATGEARRGVQVIEGATRAWYNQIPEFFKKMPGLPASTTQTASGQVVSSDDPLINELITRYGPALGFLWAARPMKENFKALKEWVTIYTDEAKQKEQKATSASQKQIWKSSYDKMVRFGAQLENWWKTQVSEMEKNRPMVYPDGRPIFPDATALFIGRVVDENGTPVENAVVALRDGTEDTTNASGYFAMMAVPKTQWVKFIYPDGRQFTEVITLYPGAPTQNNVTYQAGFEGDSVDMEDWIPNGSA